MLCDSESRYLLILTENYAALGILQQELLNIKDAIIIFGSSFPRDQEYTQASNSLFTCYLKYWLVSSSALNSVTLVRVSTGVCRKAENQKTENLIAYKISSPNTERSKVKKETYNTVIFTFLFTVF